MAISKCPHCKGTAFELKENSPRDSRFRIYFIQCSGCGAPFATMDYFNTGTLMEKQEKKIAELSEKMDQLDHTTRAILATVQR